MANDILGLLKDMTNIASGIKNIDLNTKIMQIQAEMYSMLDENRNLRLENEELKRNQQAATGIEKQGDFYYLPSDQYPFCSKCFEVDRLLVHVHEVNDWETYICPNCKTESYRTKEYVRREQK